MGLWAAELLETGEVIGQCGLVPQTLDELSFLEIGYLFERRRWHQGYAAEAARACRDHAFSALKFEEVFSIIRDINLASQRVARCIGMEERGSFIKHYYGMDMLHIVFSVRQGEQLPPAGSP